MKKLLYTLTLTFFVLLLTPQQAQAQYYCSYGVAYGTSYTWQSGSSVYFYSSTELDYCAGLYYDPATWGRYSEGSWASENVRMLAQGYTEGYADWVPAEILFNYGYPYHNQYYNTDTRHYVLEYYQQYYCFYSCGYYWYDPWGWGFAEGGSYGGPNYYGYGGAGYWQVRRRKLGDTWHTIQYRSSACQSGQQFDSNGNSCPTPTPTPVPTPPVSPPTVNINKVVIVPKKGKESWFITVNNNPNNLPITLSLTRTEGTGEAKFESNDSVSMQITQTQSVSIKGVTESSKTDNIKLEAKYNGNLLNDSSGQPAVDPFSVLWVTLSFRSSGTVSPDNQAAAFYAQALGTSNLGLLYSRGAPVTNNIWRHGVEIVGTVAPSDFPYTFNLARTVIESRLYENNNPTPLLTVSVPDDTSQPEFRDDAPPTLYDLDGPGIPATAGPAGTTTPVGTKKRRRTNFRQWASYYGLQVSDDLFWYQRISVAKTSGEDIIANDLPNDNIVGVGTTDLGLGAAPTPTPTAPPRRSGFVAQSVPLSMEAGLTYTVSVTVRNDGSETWTNEALYRLGSQNPHDNGTWGMGRVALPGPVAPGQQVTFNFDVTAPSTPGSYNFQWRMVQDGVEWFGDHTTNVVVDVYSLNYCYDYWAEQNCYNYGGWWDSSTCQCYGGYGGGGYYPY
jgi:hypothetical protein